MPAPRDSVCQDFPDLFMSSDKGDMAEAKKLCWTVCTQREQCLDYALAIEVYPENGNPHSKNYRFGVYGGLGPGQRTDLARERRAAGPSFDLVAHLRDTIVTLPTSVTPSSQARLSA